MIFERFVVVLGAAAARARTLKNQVFAWKVYRISVFGVFRARPEKTENETKSSTENNTKKQVKAKATVTAKRNRKSSFLEPKWLPKSTPEAVGGLLGTKLAARWCQKSLG